MTDAPLIDMHNATIYRGDTRVFENFSLTIEQHEQVAILGPNGCGKTTLLKTLNREIYPVIEPDSWVRILGRERWNVWDLHFARWAGSYNFCWHLHFARWAGEMTMK